MIMLVKYLSEKTALSVYRPLWRHLRYRSVHTTNCLLSEEEAKRKNEINIQMLTESLHNQIFTEGKSPRNGNSRHGGDLSAIERSLKKHGLWGKKSTVLPDVDFELPRLFGNNIDEHFRELALQQLVGYYELTEQLMDCSPPPKPKEWARTVGWTKYDPVTGEATPVPYPDEEILVFDIEILIEEGHYPTMATAVSPTNWYSWCAGCVLKDKYRWVSYPYLSDLIPMETLPGQHTSDSGQWKKRIVIGHNVGFDRSFIKEQYYVKKTKTKFLDTMSLHIAICGLTNFQRVLYQASRKNSNRKEVREYMEGKQARHQFTETEWQEKSSLNNLNDVYQLHCNGEPLQKGTRDVFVSGSMSDVRENYQTLMTYCAGDVEATLKVFQKLWPEFLLRFPHPVTLAGMFEMVSAYLPVNKNWQQYIGQSNAVYDDLQIELQKSLQKLADDSCQLLHNEHKDSVYTYKDDPWLWDLDWSVSEFKMNKPKKKEIRKKDETSEEALKRILDTKERIPKRPVHMAGYPGWYKALCPKKKQENWAPGPSLISTQMRVTPKLMRLTWNGYPLHYHDEYGWGYIVPDKFKAAQDRENMVLLGEDEQKNVSQYPIRSVFQFCGDKDTAEWIKPMSDEEFENLVNNSSKIAEDSMEWDEKRRHFEINGFEPKSKTKPKKSSDDDDRIDIGIPGCWFYRLPHKDGKKKNVGNPLAKDFLQHIEAGTLKACSGTQADRALTLSKKCSYWKNNQDRIGYQMAVALDLEELPDTVTSNSEFEEDSFYGAIVPRIVPAGTITRRAVEKTWLTASNAYVDRVGSELKAMIQSPPGYHFVGADVDSQELWIAAIIGDSYSKIHGSTPFGWMTLQGKKSDKTDLHSKTAETVSISRDHAKVFNYGRIYGAGQKFAETLLMQFNHKLTPLEAQEKARLMYTTTKGRRSGKNRKWIDGTESEMFNRLEEIATCKQPKTPVLSCSISKSLEPENIGDDFMTSRINWVVQSSAVDYLHLMLVCMKWLFEEYDIDGRFAISIHDEVRYLVASKDRYRAALALQITNLLTRSMFAYKLGMKDLPQSVAFFSAVDIDHCLRKEVNMECKTPSNPHGMERGYNISNGEALDIHEVLEKTNQSLEAKGEEPEKTEVVMAS